jgi:predicted nuclease of predicted toxin-antitoxin system
LIARFGTPPQILWVTCGNVTNRNLKGIFSQIFPDALKLLECGEPVVEISDLPKPVRS